MLNELVLKNRSYRRFDENVKISRDELVSLISLAGKTPSTVNSQALKFMPVCDEDRNAKVFETLFWAGLLKDWNGPAEGERPVAYIIILCDLSIGKDKRYDDGIAAQTIMLGAAEMGYGGCILGAVDREKLACSLNIDTSKYSVDLVLALGKPNEKICLTEVGADGSTAYYRDENGTHYVPKRKIEDIII